MCKFQSNKMDLCLFLLVFTIVWKSATSLQCYHCIPEKMYQSPHTPLCDTFDGSEKFIVDCPDSTMCYKKETALISLGATTKSVERRCATQTRGPEQVKINGKWEYRKTIYELYEEGCEDDSTELGRSTKTTHCFCRGDLCNSASNVGLTGVSAVLCGVMWIARNLP